VTDDADASEGAKRTGAVGVIGVIVGEDKILDRLLGHGANGGDKASAELRGAQCVDDHDAFGGNHETGVAVEAAVVGIEGGDVPV
jgi:hypothetical protein